MKKSLYLLVVWAVMVTACSKKEELAIPEIADPEVVPMSAEPAEPNGIAGDQITIQDPAVLEPTEDDAVSDAQMQVVESVDDDQLSN
ncbi:hypothetical protein M2R47_08315 [Moraxella sp. Tifton1]|uniref:hypothetical protein n=1 Tax=Moraxella oculi TaxID=2940516 RepID=UPI0020137FCF|nr:hypothetical protein [Moraxella sp. Tifton1]MCL1624237.1 hypothetical protein [Moraxella sp. Tifton1]